MTSKIINLFGAPCAGKSSLAARLYSDYSCGGIKCELVTEFAKDLTWAERFKDMRVQPYIFGKQLLKIERLIGKVDVIITDSPLLLSLIYTTEKWPPSYSQSVYEIYNGHNNYNFLLHRNWEYSSVGRNQTEKEATEIHEKIEGLLHGYNVHYVDLYVNRRGPEICGELSKRVRVLCTV